MKGLVRWLSVLAALPIIILFGVNFDLPPNTIQISLFAVLSLPFFYFCVYKRNFPPFNSYKTIILIGFVFVIFNILLSEDVTTSLLYWISYLMLCYGFYCWLFYVEKTEEYERFKGVLNKRLGVFIAISTLIILALLFMLDIKDLKTFNSLGIIGGSAICYMWFTRDVNKLLKWSLIAMLAAAIILSLSRSSLVFAVLAILIVETLMSQQGKGRKILICISGLVFVFFFSDQLLEWIAQKESGTVNSYSQLGKINDDRSNLIANFFQVYDNNFFTGYGVNVSYQEFKEWNSVDNIHVHNGILDTILLVGVPLTFIFLYFYFKALWKSFKLSRNNATYTSLFAFLLYYLFRGYGESYFMVNIGNMMSVCILISLIYLLNHKKVS